MTNMPRDSRGWIICTGDVLTDGSLVVSVSDGGLLLEVGHGIMVESSWSSSLEVDPFRSPERTNYERWLADIGTRDDIECALLTLCPRNDDCGCCPFDNWGFEFSVHGMHGCGGMFDWINMRAVRL